ncbi:PH domain-containing protein [Halomarina oriensis]|uniref:PH domain-containing protein n=1 Tax=Halomarina oriensis TaxID=671145 RepID=A0A6B0GJF3_9EURY|nr:PH domain-containing protein [Halomarina oriensis]MWG33971.1 PH domain-containing protein [Halomarina oriensis]
MRLDVRSIPYRAGESVTRLVWLVAIVAITGGNDTSLAPPALLLAGAVVLVVALAAGYQVLYFRRFTYDLTDQTFDIRSGIVSRRTREIPLRRIQNVDIAANPVQRALGIAEVRLETAGGSGTEATLRYVSRSEARRLQDDIGRLNRGESAVEDADAERYTDADGDDPLFAITMRELFLLGFVSVDLRILSFLSVGVPLFAPSLGDVVAPTRPLLVQLSPITLGVGGLLVLYTVAALVGGLVAVTNYYGFTLRRAHDELRYERGLLQRYSGTIPLDKVQSLSIKANVLARAIGHGSLAVVTAGYAPGEGGSQSAVPFAERDRVVSLAQSIESFDDPEYVRPPKRARTRYAIRYLAVALGVVALAYAVVRFTPLDGAWWGTLVLLPVVPVAAQATWSARGYAIQGDYVLARNGYVVQREVVVPYHRIQTVTTASTVFQRRRDLATLVVDTAGSGGYGGQDAQAVDIDTEDADRLREEVERRMHTAVAERRSQHHRERTESLRDTTGPVDDGPSADRTTDPA